MNYEPKNALDGGIDGLDLVKKVIYMSYYILILNGLLALEIGFNQYQKGSRLLKIYKFPFAPLSVACDISLYVIALVVFGESTHIKV